jgi:hypothetical protein
MGGVFEAGLVPGKMFIVHWPSPMALKFVWVWQSCTAHVISSIVRSGLKILYFPFCPVPHRRHNVLMELNVLDL